MDNLTLAAHACWVAVVKIRTMAMWVLLYYQFVRDGNHFSSYLCMSLIYRLHQMVIFTELYACLNGTSLNIDWLMMTPDLWLPI